MKDKEADILKQEYIKLKQTLTQLQKDPVGGGEEKSRAKNTQKKGDSNSNKIGS